MGDAHYAVDILRVREIIRPIEIVSIPHASSAIVGVADHRGEVVPVLDLRDRFGLEPLGPTRRTKWILVEVDARPVGLVVDAVTEVLAVSEPERRAVPEIGVGGDGRGVEAVYSHGGRLVFVLDIDRVTAVANLLDPTEGRRDVDGAEL